MDSPEIHRFSYRDFVEWREYARLSMKYEQEVNMHRDSNIALIELTTLCNSLLNTLDDSNESVIKWKSLKKKYQLD